MIQEKVETIQDKVGEIQHHFDELREDFKQYVKEHLSPEVVDVLKKFVDRCEALMDMQSEINNRYNLKILHTYDSGKPFSGDQDSATYLLTIIKKKLALLEETRMECVLNGTLADAEHDLCTLEKAYLELKVDLESYIRLRELKDTNNQ